LPHEFPHADQRRFPNLRLRVDFTPARIARDRGGHAGRSCREEMRLARDLGQIEPRPLGVRQGLRERVDFVVLVDGFVHGVFAPLCEADDLVRDPPRGCHDERVGLRGEKLRHPGLCGFETRRGPTGSDRACGIADYGKP